MRAAAVLLALLGWSGVFLMGSLDPAQTARAYLVAFSWLAALPLGALAFLMIGHATGGRWQHAIAAELRAASATVAFLVPAFLILLLVLPDIYPWAQADKVAKSPLWQHRAVYMNTTGFALRGLGALLLWSFLAWKMQAEQSTGRVQRLACLGLVAHMVMTGIVAVDWMASLEGSFRSSIFGWVLMLAQALTSFALLTLMACRTERSGPLYDLGSLLLALVMLTSYLEMSQLVIFWMGNIPEETGWLSIRVFGAWGGLGVSLFLVQRLLPFLLLIWSPIKKSPRQLAAIACLISVLAPLHFAWLVTPSFHPHELFFAPALLPAFTALGATWWLAFSTLLARHLEAS